jgi:hypothetical protein
VNGDVPSQAGEPPLEGGGVVEDLDDPEPPAVVEPADGRVALRVSRAALLLVQGFGAQGVDEESQPAGPERGPDEVPERIEALRGHVREPEPEKDRVVDSVRAPAEQVGLDVAYSGLAPGFPEPGAVDLQHLR